MSLGTLLNLTVPSWAIKKPRCIQMKNLKEGKTYIGRFISNYDSTFEVAIIKRTEKSVTFIHPHSGKNKRAKIHNYDGCEFFMPFGNYSMSPIISA